ncbi:SGNH hydrolase domain-containing protein [Candidatus Levibacter sp. Uisw_134_01]|uniref:SGNH hydrolase domain-containing protein n=1 Tax=Candidatus Levibacter sp. Uisw_134_01 TaxID=3230999 RepID=UPI003D549382
MSAIVISLAALTFVNYDFISKDGYKDRLPPILSKQNLYEEVWNHFKQEGRPCYQRFADFCRIDNDINLTRVHALSDSHLSSMSPQLVSSLGNEFNYLEINTPGCPFVLNVNNYDANGNIFYGCSSDHQNFRLKSIEQKPSIILLGGRFHAYISSRSFVNKKVEEFGDIWLTFKSENNIPFVEEFKNTVQLLISQGHKVVLIYPIPEVGVSVPHYILNSIKGKSVSDMSSDFEILNTSYEVYQNRSKSTFELFDSIQSPNIYRVYPHTLFCNKQLKGRCVTHDYDNVFYADSDHPSAKGSEMIVELIMEQINKAEVNIRGN